MSTFSHDDLVLIVGAFVVCMRGLLFARSLWRQFTKGARLRSSLLVWRSRVADTLLRLWQEENNPIEDCVRRTVNEQIENDMRQTMRTSANFWSIAVASILCNICLKAPRWMTQGQDMVLIALALLSILATQYPPPRRWIGFWYSFNMLCGLLFVTAGQSRTIMIFASGSLWCARLVLSNAYRRLCAVCIWNSLYVCVAYYSYSQLPAGDSLVAPRMYLMYETCQALFVAVWAFARKNSLWVDARNRIQASLSRGESSAMLAMWNLVCDVAVELDDNLQVKGDVPRLAATFMVNPTTVKGMKLQQLMPFERDRYLFEEHMGASCEGDQDATGLIQVKMRDGLGSDISVELFYVRYQVFDRNCFLVGLRENADQTIAELKSFKKKSSKPKKSSEPASSDGTAESKATADWSDRSAGSGTMAVLSKGDLRHDTGNAQVDASDVSSEHSVTSSSEHSTKSTESNVSDTRKARTSSATEAKAKRVTLMKAMRTFRVENTQRWCCHFHAAAAEAGKALAQLKSHTCVPSFKPLTGKQCQRCGMLAELSASQCSACRAQHFRTSSVASL